MIDQKSRPYLDRFRKRTGTGPFFGGYICITRHEAQGNSLHHCMFGQVDILFDS